MDWRGGNASRLFFVQPKQAGRPFPTKGVFQSGQMGQTVNLLLFSFGGSNPSAPTQTYCGSLLQDERKLAFAARRSEDSRKIFVHKQKFCGNSSVDRALAFQAGGRGFESRFPLDFLRSPYLWDDLFFFVCRKIYLETYDRKDLSAVRTHFQMQS